MLRERGRREDEKQVKGETTGGDETKKKKKREPRATAAVKIRMIEFAEGTSVSTQHMLLLL